MSRTCCEVLEDSVKQPTADVGNDNTEGAPDIITVGIELGMLRLTAAGEAAAGKVVEVAPTESGPEIGVAVIVLVVDGEFTEEIANDGCADVERSHGLGGLEETKQNFFLPSNPMLQ